MFRLLEINCILYGRNLTQEINVIAIILNEKQSSKSTGEFPARNIKNNFLEESELLTTPE